VIYGRENSEREMQAEGDIVYLSAGRDMGIRPGAEFVIQRPFGPVQHPITRLPVGVYVRRLGLVRVIAVQPTTSTAEITLSCDAILEGDYLLPHRELPIPMIERVPLAKLATPYPGRLTGMVVVGPDPKASVAAAGDIVGIDLSSHGGLTIGDRVLFWRPGPGAAPRRVIAQGVVLSTSSAGSMVKVLETAVEIKPGDEVEIL
jgi:hypothetical protein